jgi:hypothetical protein
MRKYPCSLCLMFPDRQEIRNSQKAKYLQYMQIFCFLTYTEGFKTTAWQLFRLYYAKRVTALQNPEAHR